MSLLVSDEQLQVAATSGDLVEVFDPSTQATFVLLRSDVFRSLQDSELVTVRAMYPLINELMAEDDKNDPLLDSYQHYAREAT